MRPGPEYHSHIPAGNPARRGAPAAVRGREPLEQVVRRSGNPGRVCPASDGIGRQVKIIRVE